MTVNSGHVVIEENGSVNELNVPQGADATVNIQPQGQVNTVVMDSDSATINAEQGSTINQIVGETENISGAGAAEAKETAVEKTVVSTKKELDDAIADEENVKYIVLANNIDTLTRITIDRDLIIDGTANKYSLTASNEKSDNSRLMNVGWDNNYANVTLKNLILVGPTQGGYTRGVNLGQTGTSLILDNCEVSCKYYAINVISTANNTSLQVTNSTITGWAAINLWSSIKVDVSNSTLVGKSISKDENFATICFEC